MLRILLVFLMIIGLIGNVSIADASASSNNGNDDTGITTVMCNVIKFVQKLGLPIMTGVILGSSIMAIFGKLPWPAIVMLVVFTAIFFGAGKLMTKFANGVSSSGNSNKDVCDNGGGGTATASVVK
ncbi:type IV secretion system protein VirB2 [Ehrlichia ruminantium]|uniref:TrbC/VirB2 family protein n=1 Tax=Ehrlichia ruminantium TaxID=779 RepID=UPI0007C11481|nr:TrbC/VirB2 family protein [Ehrlichia ruminantium]GAT75732.1 type IV secretion system protein VirB2 [Ehrlichia ruminantium]